MDIKGLIFLLPVVISLFAMPVLADIDESYGYNVSGAGTSEANGIYCPQNETYNECPYYNFAGTNYQMRYGDESGLWAILDTGIAQYNISSGDCTIPLIEWQLAAGDSPAPILQPYNCTSNETIWIPPIIYEIDVGNITYNSAIITWLTDQPANSTINYGEDTGLGSTEDSSDEVTEHEIELTELDPETLYFFEVMSENEGGTTVDNNSDEYYNFTTLASPTTTTTTTTIPAVVGMAKGISVIVVAMSAIVFILVLMFGLGSATNPKESIKAIINAIIIGVIAFTLLTLFL